MRPVRLVGNGVEDMTEKLAHELIVIGYNPQAYRFIFEALLKELQK